MVYLHCFPTLQAPWKQSSSLSVLPGLLNKKLTDSWATIHASYFKPLSLGEGVVTQQELTSTSYLSPVQSISRVRLFATPWIEARQASLSITNSHSFPNSCPSSWWCHPAISSSYRPLFLLPPIPPSIRVFSNESALHKRWPKYWSFSLSISPSNEHPGLISFRMDWLDLLAVQGTLKSLLQHHCSKTLILWSSTFFTVQLSHPYMTTGKTTTLTRWTFVGKAMSLLLNMLSRLVITFLPRSKCF